MTYTATYSPEDNKLRLYASARLDKETYERVRAAGFIWAPRQELFVAPMWTPEREDIAVELAGEIGDEDTSLVDRAEERAGRFEDYSENRAQDADRAHAAVHAITDNIPFGQPILIGHHSERHARRDAEKIEHGMRRAVKMWETAEYWKRRAAGAISAAKYKELPQVRARRIKGLESDQRKRTKIKADYENTLKLWSREGLTQEQALAIANYEHGGEVTLADGSKCWSAWSALNDGKITVAEVVTQRLNAWPRWIARCDRWLNHFANRLEYERAMLADSGGIATDRTGPEVGGACKCWASHRGGFSYIVKVNKVTVSVLDNWRNSCDQDGSRNFRRTIPFDKLSHVMSKAEVDQARADGLLFEFEDKTGFMLNESTPPPPPEPAQTDDQAEKFDAMRESLKAGVQTVSAPQLFPTPSDLAARMVQLASIEAGQEVLEPSAGTGAIVDAVRSAMADGRAGRAAITAVEINHTLAHRLAFVDCLGAARVHEKDFLECNGDLGQFERILMNPPFQNGADIKHITHALTFLKPGGRLVAICAGGPRQEEKLKPLASFWEPLPAGTFKESGTGVNTVLLTIDK